MSRIVLPCLPASVPAARREVRALIETWGASDEVAEIAALLTGELATNAVLHARTPFEVEARLLDDDVLRVTVSDGSMTLPQLRPYVPTSTEGRGLRLVAEFATDWGVLETRDGPGKHVWFELPLHGEVVTTGAGRFADPPDRWEMEQPG